MEISYKTRKRIAKYTVSTGNWLLRTILFIGISFVILYPVVSKILISFMTVEDVYDASVQYIPKHWTFRNYINAWDFLDMNGLLLNSFLYPLITSFVQMCSATLVAYGFARYNFRGKNLLFVLVVVAMVIPPDLTLLPLYMGFRYFDIGISVGAFRFGLLQLITGKSLNLLNTVMPYVLLGITCTGLKNGLYIFLMRQYFRGLPKELEEASYVDGASTPKAFLKVFLPSATQIMMTVFLFSCVWQWLDDLYASVFLQNVDILATALTRLLQNANFVSAGISNLTEISLLRNCAMLFLIIPMLVLYLICQKYFTESVERSGLVG